MLNNRLQEPLPTHLGSLDPSWKTALAPTWQSSTWQQLVSYIDQRLAEQARIYPAQPLRALGLTPLDEVRVVILGQDPYHGPGQAHGLAFSVPSEQRRPPSLRNIFNEVAHDCGGDPQTFDNDLSRWARQGVLLLNTILTVEDGQAASHAGKGWESITDAIIRAVAHHPRPKAFLLWGAHAQSKQALLPQASQHLVLKANHPSPLSARRPPIPFLGCGHFARVNQWLEEQGQAPIKWV